MPARDPRPPASADAGYAELSKRPLHVLVFLLPLIVFYEVGSALYLADPERGLGETIRAHNLLLGFFQDFGAAGRLLPAVALVTVLLVWHIFNHDRTRIRPLVIGGIAMEAVAWTLPLLVAAVLVQQIWSQPPPPAAEGPATEALRAMPWQARMTVSVGAGLYEEMLFRMIGIAAMHFLFVDIARFGEAWGRGIAVVATTIAFTIYHDLALAGGGLDRPSAVVLILAGLYFGSVYLLRGFAVVVGVHALYDILVLVLLPSAQ